MLPKNHSFRRTAMLLCAALGLTGLGLAGPAAAQVTGPLLAPYTSPPQPTPFQWQNYHSGGAPVPAGQYLVPAAPAAPPAFLTPLIDPLQSQLQGMPSELYGGSLTEIPSFLLENYDPTRPPAGLNAVTGLNTYYPNHFADGSIFSWAAPFSYLPQSVGSVTVDDSQGPPTSATGVPTASGFTATTGWTSVTAPGAATPGNDTSPAAGNATNSEYLRLAPGIAGSAVWTLFEPAAGNYSLYFHIPSDLPDSAGNVETRNTQVEYFVRVLDASGNVTTSTTATASQTEANDSQFLAGPFPIAAGGSVVVTLTRTTNAPFINYDPNNPYYLVADSMTLQQTIGDVQSAPTVVTRTSYPTDFARAQYWGIYVPATVSAGTSQPVSTSTNAATAAAANAVPDTTTGNSAGNILLKTGSTATALGTAGVYDPTRLIRQLVYFGRADPAASVTASVDDSSTTQFAGGVGGTTVTSATASNGEYKAFATQMGTAPAAGGLVATWTVPVPAAGAGSSFFVYAHIPATPTGETRLTHVFYTVTVNGGTPQQVAISQVTQGTDALVVLPTGPLTPAVGSSIVVRMYNQNDLTTSSSTATKVVADSVNVSTGTGQGAIYCVDGFTGGVLWRYETPGSANGASAPVFASPAIAKINVLITPAAGANPAVYANKLVVIVGDNNGLVYCLDAIGNGDGTSNDAVLNQTTLQPITIPQPAYGTTVAPIAAGTTYAAAAAAAHVGTTGVYWIYRPDAAQPKYVTGTNRGAVKPVDPTMDVPVPAAFNTASPTIFVDPTVATATPTASNSIVYIGNSNGVLYALDGGGAPINGASAATFTATGDTFNVSQTGLDFDIPTGTPANPYPLTAVVPTTQPRWWFSLRGPDPNSAANASSADIESAPALYVKATATTTAGVTTTTYVPTVYIGSAHEMESTSNVGRLYALNGLYGPAGDNGQISPATQPNPLLANYTGPGSFNYNVGQRPTLVKDPMTGAADTSDWTFPDAYGTYKIGTATVTGQSYKSGTTGTGGARPALGNITGSPVVFTNIDETVNNPTRIYIAANSGYESTTTTPTPTARPDDTTTGRLWAVNLDGSVGVTTNSTDTPHSASNKVWAYPLAFDPNDAAKDNVPQPYAPIGSFLRATPATGFVQFPAVTQFNFTAGGGATAYNPVDAVHTAGISGASVPMLYVATRGVNDTALYAVDVDGDMTTPISTTTTTSGTLASDSRSIYRVVSPDGSIFQSSPALVTNATSTGGNGGGIYAVAGDTLYDYGATPISNPFAGENFPLIRENAALVGFGPISSPALAGADTTDLSTAFLGTVAGAAGTTNTSGFRTNTTDWVIVGDSSTGLCRGITPNDLSYGGIPPLLNTIVPPIPNPPIPQVLDAIIQTFLVQNQTSVSSANAFAIGTSAPLQVYEWGESAYARFTNVAPPNPVNPATGNPDPNLFVYDTRKYMATDLANATASNPIPFYSSDGTTAQTVTFSLSDADTTKTGLLSLDNGSVQPRIVTTPPDGFVVDAGSNSSFADVTTNLVANNGNRYLGTYTYTIADGTARNNMPGARRRFQNVKQLVTEYDYTGGGTGTFGNYKPMGTVVIGGDAVNQNLVSQKTVDPVTGAVTYGFNPKSKVAAVDQPTFGILNPLGARGGGVPLLPPGNTAAVAVGDELGPFRSVTAPPTLTTNTSGTTTTTAGDAYALQALTNGNDVLTAAPPSSSGVGGSPVLLPNAASDPNGITTPTITAVLVTTTGEISHNSSGGNNEASAAPTGSAGTSASPTGDGLLTTGFGGYSLDVFDRGALFNLGQTLRLKMTVPTNTLFAPPSGRDGLYWNSNAGTDATGHDSVVNFLPWETPPTPYLVGTPNASLDYPDIAPGNVAQNAATEPNRLGVSNSGGDLTSNSVTLTRGVAGGGANPVKSRTIYGDPVQIRVTVPNHQPANQQLYQETPNQTYTAAPGGHAYQAAGQVAPVTINPSTGAVSSYNISASDNVFPMGYVTTKRLYVPSATGYYSPQRPYRDVRVYTGIPIDMRTSVANTNPTTDIGKVPAAFGVQTEDYPSALSNLFTPYNPYFQPYFKPLEVHNDGNVNLLNVHFDQKISNGSPVTLQLQSDAIDPLSAILGYDLASGGSAYGITGPRDGMFGTASVPEQAYLIRSSLDTDLVRTYDRNPNLPAANYPGATFHKPVVGSDQPSVLSIPDSPEGQVPGYNIPASPNGLPQTGYSAPPFVSFAVPFGTPVGTYETPAPQQLASLRLFEGLDTAATAYSLSPTPSGSAIPSSLFPPQYGQQIGGIGTPTVDHSTGEPLDSGRPQPQPEDIYNGLQPLSTTGTQLIGTVLEQRMTDGATYGAVPMIDSHPAVSNGATPPVYTSTPDFAPAAFRDPATGNLSVYWTSGRTPGTFGIFGANLPFVIDPSTADPKHGYFTPVNRSSSWWSSIGGYTGSNLNALPGLAAGTNSGLSVAAGPRNAYAFAVNVAPGTPYNNTLYSYNVSLVDGTFSTQTTAQSQITPSSSASQVKYGVKGLYTGFTNNNGLYAFWTGTTRGRTALYYSAKEANNWPQTATLLPVPAGLTAVADASPMLMPDVPVNGQAQSVIEVTYSGTAPGGNADLYVSRYYPDAATPAQLDLVPFPAVTENLDAAGGWYQARDVAWSRTGALNVSVLYKDANGNQNMPLLYGMAAPYAPKFTKAIYDKASGLLVLTGVQVPIILTTAGGTQTYTTHTVYVDAATGRVRFSPALLPTQNFARIEATFSPTARRLTVDSRADTAPVTFLDEAQKVNDGPGLQAVTADRRWTIWRKSGVAGVPSSATLYFKTQRLTYFLPSAISLSAAGTPVISGITVNGTDVTSQVDVDYARGRLYFPVSTGAEGQTVSLTYTPVGGTSTSIPADPLKQNTIQWQDEPLANNNDVPPVDSAAGLDAVIDNAVPIDTATNENNPTAFLDPFAGATSPHKVWLFWNSTRNGTADIYSETIDPRFAPGPATP